MLEDFLVENNITQLRAKKNWPQWKLSLAAKIAESRISLLEQGAPPRATEIEKLTKVFNVESDDIWPESLK